MLFLIWSYTTELEIPSKLWPVLFTVAIQILAFILVWESMGRGEG